MKTGEVLSFWQARHLEMGPGEGLRFGSPDAELAGILVCFLPTLEAIRSASRLGCNLIVAREQFSYPMAYSGALVDHYLSDKVNLRRIGALAEGGIAVVRAGKSLDAVVLDGLAEGLGLPEPQICAGIMDRIYHIAPQPARELAHCIGDRMGLSEMRVCGNLERVVRRVALLPGDAGSAHNPGGLAGALRLRPDVLIAGQTDDYPMRAALDMGLPIIEVGHARSLTPGLQRLAAMLAGQFPGLRVEFYENPRPWQAV